MSVTGVSTLYPFASYTPATSTPAPQTVPTSEPSGEQSAPQAQQAAPAAAPAERAEEPKKASSGPGQIIDRKV